MGRRCNSRTFAEQFEENVRFTVGCWFWTGRTSSGGYGKVRTRFDGQHIEKFAHRYSYEHFVGPIPEGLTIDHLCRNKLCVNPAHLDPVTFAENTKRMWAAITPQILESRRARTTHCLRGHEYTPENTYSPPAQPNWRNCKICTRERKAKRDRRKVRL